MPSIIQRIQHHFANPDPQNRQIGIGFMWVGLFVLVGKLAGAAKEMGIAWRYGVSSTVDAYVLILNVINWPIAVWFGMLTVVLLPLFARYKSASNDELSEFRSELLGFTLVIGLAVAILFWWGLTPLLSSKLLGLTELALMRALEMVGAAAILGPLGMIISLFSVCLLSLGRHRNTLFESIPALVLLVVLVAMPNAMPEPLIWGTIAGYALHVAALGASLARRGELPVVRFTGRSPAWPFFWAGIGIISMGQALSSFTALVDQFFAAGLGEGALSTLNYANRILALLLGLGATAISRATLPVFSEAVGKAGSDISKQAFLWASLMTFFGLIVLLVSWLFAPSVVALLFERGAFNAANTLAVADILRISLFQVVFYFPSIVLVALLSAQRRFGWIAVSGAINFLSKLAFTIVLVPMLGMHGLVISTVLMYATSAFLLTWIVLASRKQGSRI